MSKSVFNKTKGIDTTKPLERHAVKKKKKTKTMLFDSAKTKDFSQKLKINNDIV